MADKLEKADSVKYWLDTEKYDIESAQVMLNGGRYLYVGFMCHLTIEKGLKAVISSRLKETPPKIHDLIKLAKQSDIYTNMSEEQQNFLEVLLPLNIEARYPSYKNNIAASLNELKCNDILSKTEDLLKWIEQQLSIQQEYTPGELPKN